MTGEKRVAAVTCLGCGCACDDLTVEVRDGRIAGVTPPCPLALAWFGDGRLPMLTTRAGEPAQLGEALSEAATLLSRAGRVLVYLAPDISTPAQRAAIAVADLLRATVDTATSEPAAAGLLAAQRRGRSAATLGELRNRGDVLLFWGVDPTPRYPRYLTRYVLDPVGTHVDGRAARTVISVSIGTDRGPGGDIELALPPEREIDALSVMRAVALGNPLGDLPADLQPVAHAAGRLVTARYAVLVHEGEPGNEAGRDGLRAEGLIALTQALNGPTRAALSTLRAGGNRSGAEAALTWQTGYPMSVTFASGAPEYLPGRRGLAALTDGELDAALIVGAAGALGPELDTVAARVPMVLVGPRASEWRGRARVAIDTGVAGIHEGGIAYRMDDVPLPLRPPLPGGRTAVETLSALRDAIAAQGRSTG